MHFRTYCLDFIIEASAINGNRNLMEVSSSRTAFFVLLLQSSALINQVIKAGKAED